MFRLEIKHALKMFITKTMAEIKQSFQEAIPNAVQDHYELKVDDDNDKTVEGMAGQHGIVESPELQGSFAFQIRIIQEEKLIQIHGFSKHHWDKPTINNEPERRWGMFRIPVLTQACKTALADKYLQRKIEIFVNISYLEKGLHSSTETKRFGKLKNN